MIRSALKTMLGGATTDGGDTATAATPTVAVEPKPAPAARDLGRVFGYCFVTGAQKSGTTWVGWLLRAHPAIKVRGEAGYLGSEHDATTWIDEAALDAFLAQPSPKKLLGGITRDDLLAAAQRGVVESMLRLSCEPDEHTRVLGDRAPHAYCLGVDRLHRLFPDAVYVDVVRDGRDVAVSNAFMMLRNRKWNEKSFGSMQAGAAAYRAHVEGTGPADTPLLGENMIRHYANRWAECVASSARARALFGDRYIGLRYESMLEDAQGPMRRLFEALGVDASDGVVARCVAEASFENKSGGRKPGEQDVGSFVRKGVAGDWRHYFNARERDIFNEHAGQTLIDLGYAESMEWCA